MDINGDIFRKSRNGDIFYVGSNFSNKGNILVSTIDGLGNQMFQYAFALFLQKHLGKDYNVYYDPRWFRQSNCYREEYLSRYKLSNKVNVVDKNLSAVIAKIKFDEKSQIDVYDKVLDGSIKFDKDINLWGYWHNVNYIKDVIDDFRSSFIDKDLKIDECNKNILDNIQDCNSVSIHVRRNDYFRFPERYTILDKDYYSKAKEIIRSKISDPVFYCFSEDLQWVKENIVDDKGKFVLVDNNLSKESDCVYDMLLMKNCKHNIIANSTFSLCSAELNSNKDKIVISPKEWGNSFSDKIIDNNWICV